ncbi:TPA: N-6 DNA methylase, partial [Proteus mirabilis]|nr:N-6 DNA methylase [Proteus mirabilis]
MTLCSLEADTRLLIDKTLENLGYSSDESNGKFKHIYREQPRSKEEQKKLKGKRPDYVIYSQETDRPLIIIEAKKKGERVDTALEQGIQYAKKLEAPIVFATDGVFCKSYHTKFEKNLILNNEEVDEFIRESLALKYLTTYEVNTISPKVQYDRKELIKIFDDANNMLRGEGLRAGIERFGEFANILFLKLISESEDIRIERGGKSFFDQSLHWEYIKNLHPSARIDYINKIVFKQLNDLYQTEIFTPLLIKDNYILSEIITKLDPLRLSDVDSDVKGDAFEYFLRESTASGNDLGEYFTPRHIVKTMVKLVNPQIGEKVYDPFCGTGGLLIESFRHIWNSMARNEQNNKFLKESTIYGNEITNTARITKMNMILAGDGHSNIKMRDSLANPINQQFDIVLTNMPYSQKTKHAGKYDIPSKNGDSICVQHCIKAISGLSENGRMAIVVPEGFLFRKDLAKTREYMLSRCNLKSVISLPQGVFLPYTGVKTDILYCEKINNPNRGKSRLNHYWYFDVKTDGYTLDNHRRKLNTHNDLDTFQEYRKTEELDNLLKTKPDDVIAIGFKNVSFDDVKNNNFNLIGSRYYSKEKHQKTKYKHHSIKDLCDMGWIHIAKGKMITKSKSNEGSIPVIAGGQKVPYYHNAHNFNGKTITISSSGAYAGFVWFHDYPIWASDCFAIKIDDENKIIPEFFYYVLKHKQDELYLRQCGTGQPHVYPNDINDIFIPIPELHIQQQLVDELSMYSKIIKNSNSIINEYKTKITIDPSWKLTSIGSICNVVRGGSPRPIQHFITDDDSGINWLKIGDVTDGAKYIESTKEKIKPEGMKKSRLVNSGDFILSNSMSYGRPYIMRTSACIHDGWLALQDISEKVNKDFLYLILSSPFVKEQFDRMAAGSTVKNLNIDIVKNVNIPLPHLDIQEKIVSDTNKERESINTIANLIDVFEIKIKE